MGRIVLKFENVKIGTYDIPEPEPLVFELFNTPTQVEHYK